jgi:ribosomal protein S8
MNDSEKIVNLKAEVFDLLAQQGYLQNQFNELDKKKQEKLKELMDVENRVAEANKPKENKPVDHTLRIGEESKPAE